MTQPWHGLSSEEVCDYWETDPGKGLTEAEAQQRLRQFGYNRLPGKKKAHPLTVLVHQFHDALILILLAAAAASLLLGETVDALTIAAIVLINTILGFVHEYRAERAVEALGALTAPEATVIREAKIYTIPAELLVPGDIIELESGDRVPADARLLDAAALEIEESALTGESVPVTKNPAAIMAPDTAIGDRLNMVYQGTVVARGHGRAVVVATGTHTEVGNLADLIQSIGDTETPLQRRLGELGRWLVSACVLICLLVVAAGLGAGQSPYMMLMAGISLAVAAIPEGLPAVVTILLGLGVQRMSRRQAVVRRLPAVETLGCTTIICSDKTGTLTENRMSVREVWLGGDDRSQRLEHVSGDPRLQRLLQSAVLCSNATGDHGSPTELGLLRAAGEIGINEAALRRRFPRLREIPFDARLKRMSVVCRTLTGWSVHVKGAPEMIIPKATRWWDGRKSRPMDNHARRQWLAAAESLAAKAFRVLAVAQRQGTSRQDPATMEPGELEQDLELLGLVGLIDPPRPEAYEALRLCRRAGIQVIMLTGDHAATAAAIAAELGLVDTPGQVMEGRELDELDDRELAGRLRHVRVFARVSPEHKLRIVRVLKNEGHVVAMTGDGVNDAPALKEADIGIAMGRGGTDVTREAADLVLLDDNFATIIAAVEEGRGIYANVRKFIRYLLASNTGEVLVMLVAMLMGLPLPLLPIHILFINLVTDGLPAVALGLEPPEAGIMNRPPRSPDESVFAHGLSARILLWGVTIGSAALALFYLVLKMTGDVMVARTTALASLVVTQMFHVIDCRSERQDTQPISIAANPALIGAVASTMAALGLIVHWPPLAVPFRTAPLTADLWLLVFLSSAFVFVLMRLVPLAKVQIRRPITGGLPGWHR